MPKAWVHNVVVLGQKDEPPYKAIGRSYYVFQKATAKRLFEEQYPRNPIIKVIDCGVSEVEFSEEKYRALQKQRDTTQE